MSATSKLTPYYAPMILVLILLAAPPFMPSFFVYLLTLFFIWGLLAVAYDVAFGHTGLLSFCHGIFYAVGGYAVVLPVLRMGVSFWIAMLMGAALSTVVGLAIGLISLRMRGVYFALVTMVFSVVAYLAACRFSWLTGGICGLNFSIPSIVFGGLVLPLSDPLVRYYFCFAIFFISFLILHRIVNSPVGKTFEAIRENEERARFIGYNTQRYRLFSFTISALFSSISGALYSLVFGYVSANFASVNMSVSALLWVLLGGAGTSLFAPVLGAAIMTTVFDYLSTWFEYYWIIGGALIIIIVMKYPRGIVGYFKSRRR